MPILRCQYVFEHSTGLPVNVTSNTWWFNTFNPTQDLNNVRDLLDDFYHADVSGNLSIARYLSSSLQTGADQLTRSLAIYNMDDAPPRVPLQSYLDDFSTAPLSANPLPAEVALVVSFQAAPESGIPQARRRNRVFLGPLNQAVMTTGSALPHANFLTTCREAGGRLIAAAAASLSHTFVAYSPTYDISGEVVEGWVDDAWDTQRSRGLAPTTRNQFDAEDDPS